MHFSLEIIFFSIFLLSSLSMGLLNKFTFLTNRILRNSAQNAHNFRRSIDFLKQQRYFLSNDGKASKKYFFQEDIENLKNEIKNLGNKIKSMKLEKDVSSSDQIKRSIESLVNLKKQFFELTGTQYDSSISKKKQSTQPLGHTNKSNHSNKSPKSNFITPRVESYSDWYGIFRFIYFS